MSEVAGYYNYANPLAFATPANPDFVVVIYKGTQLVVPWSVVNGASRAVDDASALLANRAFQPHAAPASPAGAASPVVVDDASLVMAQRTFQFHQAAPAVAAAAAAVVVDDAGLVMAQRAFQFHQPAPVAFTDVLATQIFGA